MGNIPARPEFLHLLVIRGDIEGAKFYLKDPIYGIKFRTTNNLGNKVLVLDYNGDTMYTTEEGSVLGQFRQFNFPEQALQLLEELTNESKRRFERQSLIIKNW